MKLTGESKFFIGVVAVTIAIIGAGIMLFSRPEPTYPKAEMITPDSHIKGATDSAVYLVEFSDFQCPACKAAKPIIDALVTEYQDKLVFAYRHFPLDQHPLGKRAAQAAEAAGKQGKFWEMYNALFVDQESLSEERIATIAASLEFDMNQFTTDFNDPVIAQKVENDRLAGLKFSVNSTPTFFLNGKKLNLLNFTDLRTQVNKVL